MTAEQLTVIEPSDFAAVRLVCTKCRGAITIQLNETIGIPGSCPACGLQWQSRELYIPAQAARALTDAMKQWLSHQNQSAFALKFEVIHAHTQL